MINHILLFRIGVEETQTDSDCYTFLFLKQNIYIYLICKSGTERHRAKNREIFHLLVYFPNIHPESGRQDCHKLRYLGYDLLRSCDINRGWMVSRRAEIGTSTLIKAVDVQAAANLLLLDFFKHITTVM